MSHCRTTSGSFSRLLQPLTVWFIDSSSSWAAASPSPWHTHHFKGLQVCLLWNPLNTPGRMSHTYISICWTNTDKCAASGTVGFQAELCEKWLLEDTRLVQNYQTVTPTGPHRERGAGKISTRKCRNKLIEKKEEDAAGEAGRSKHTRCVVVSDTLWCMKPL